MRIVSSDDGISIDNDDDGTPGEGAPERSPAGRAASRPRATKALPTDRMKFEKQVEVLRAFSVASRDGVQPVDGNALSTLVDVSAATVVLDNNFFLESGLITRVRKGQYLPVAEVNDFRLRSTWEDEKAPLVLTPIFAKTWFFDALRVLDEMGTPPSVDNAIRVLAQHSGADASHRPQLEILLDWLEFVSLIEYDDGKVLVQAGPGPENPLAWESKQAAPAEVAKPRNLDQAFHAGGSDMFGNLFGDKPAAGAQGAIPTTPPPVQQDRNLAPTVLAWSFEVKLTADDLAKLSPEQIKAVFEAAGTVAAVRPS